MGRIVRYGISFACAALLCAPGAAAASVKRPPLTWFRGDGNYTKASRAPGQIHYIVVHVTEGRFWGSVDWLQNERAEASANFIVSRAGKIVQLVHLSDVAWHSGNGQMNRESVGIEHAGVTDDPGGFTLRQYQASARLAAWLCRRSLIPIDRRHIIGHYEVPGSGHTDPGRYWNWGLYLKLVRRYAYPKPFPRLRVRSTTLYDGQTVAGTVPWKVRTRGPRVTRVEFKIDGKVRWSDRRAPFVFAGGRGLKTLALANGRHRLEAVAYGRSGHSAARTLRVRVFNPKLEVTTAGLRRNARVAGIVRVRANTSVPASAISVYLDGKLVRRLERKPFAFSLDVRKLRNGTHTVDLETTASDGRTASRRIPLVVANPVAKPAPPPEPPARPAPQPEPPAQIVSQSIVAGQVLQGVVAWQIGVSGSVLRVEFLVDGVVRATATAAPFGFTWDTSGEAAGLHTLVVRVVGREGLVVQSGPVEVTVSAPAAA